MVVMEMEARLNDAKTCLTEIQAGQMESGVFLAKKLVGEPGLVSKHAKDLAREPTSALRWARGPVFFIEAWGIADEAWAAKVLVWRTGYALIEARLVLKRREVEFQYAQTLAAKGGPVKEF